MCVLMCVCVGVHVCMCLCGASVLHTCLTWCVIHHPVWHDVCVCVCACLDSPASSLNTAPLRYICIRGVFILTTECPSLVVTLVLTLRKFVSLLFSIWYFQNPFTTAHWLATALVFGGTIGFSGVATQLWGKSKRD